MACEDARNEARQHLISALLLVYSKPLCFGQVKEGAVAAKLESLCDNLLARNAVVTAEQEKLLEDIATDAETSRLQQAARFLLATLRTEPTLKRTRLDEAEENKSTLRTEPTLKRARLDEAKENKSSMTLSESSGARNLPER